MPSEKLSQLTEVHNKGKLITLISLFLTSNYLCRTKRTKLGTPWLELYWKNVSFDQLREVRITFDCSDKKFELALIKLLLDKSPMLEKMLIECGGSHFHFFELGRYMWTSLNVDIRIVEDEKLWADLR